MVEYFYQKASLNDLELLIRTRIAVLRAANRLDNEVDNTDEIRNGTANDIMLGYVTSAEKYETCSEKCEKSKKISNCT